MIKGSECIILSVDDAREIIKCVYALMKEPGTKNGYETLQDAGLLQTFVDFGAAIRSIDEND